MSLNLTRNLKIKRWIDFLSVYSKFEFLSFLIWLKKGRVSKSALGEQDKKKGGRGLFRAKLLLFSCKIGLKFLKMYLKPCGKGVKF